MMVVLKKVNYLTVGVRIWFRVNCRGRVRVFGDTANFSNEIGKKWPKKGQKSLKFFRGPHI